MEMVPVVSTGVRAVGYDRETKLLRIQYASGSVYDYPDQAQEPSPPKLLETFAEDECCRLRILRAAHDGKLHGKDSWTCPKCGTEWRAQYVKLDMGEPCAKHWEPKPLIAIF